MGEANLYGVDLLSLSIIRHMNRRSFIFVSIAGLASRGARAAEAGPFVGSDVGALTSVLVHTPGREGRRGLGLGQGSASLANQPLSEEAAEEHRGFVQAP